LSDAKLFANRSALFANDAESAMIACTLTFHKITPGEGAGARFEQLDSH